MTYCKDCYGTAFDKDHYYYDECPTAAHFDEGGMRITNNTQPPPNCNCFKPRHVDETDFIDIKETSDNASVQREGQS